MGHKFAEIAFTDTVREIQQELGSRAGYASMDSGEDYNNILGQREADFIAARDSFYMASVSETGWPYVQHRGGPVGFMKIIDRQTIGFADFSGNRQYVSLGNFKKDNRVALFFMDYPNKTRLKMLGKIRVASAEESASLTSGEVEDYGARVERGFVITVEAFDWNCPQHITPRFTESQVRDLMAPVIEENQALRLNRNNTSVTTIESLGDGPLELVISGVRQLTPRIRLFELRDPGGAWLPQVEAGSHLKVPVRLTNDQVAIRHYSICSDPARRDIYQIAVLREEDGKGGSVAAHQQFNLGLRLNCDLPENNFPLHTDGQADQEASQRPALLIAGGIGITAIRSMARSLKARGAPLEIHYAGRREQEMAFLDSLLDEFGSRLTIYRSDAGERLNVENILSHAPDDGVFYICGPGRLIDAFTHAANSLNIDEERIRFERFTSDIGSNARPVTVDLHRSGIRIQVPADQSILDAIIEAGIDAPYSCGAGNCRTCAVKVLAGEPEHRDSALSVTEREDHRLICPCVSRARGDNLVLDI